MLKKHLQPKKIHIRTHDNQQMPVLTLGKGKPVILLHGFGMEAGAWLPLVLPLAGKYQFFLPYLRGFGKASSLTFSQPDFFADYVADVHAMREQLGLHKVALGGISMGAMTCMALNAADKFTGVQRCLLIDQSPVVINKPDWQWGLMGSEQAAFLEKLWRFYHLSEAHQHKAFEDVPDEVRDAMVDAVTSMIGASFQAKSMRQLARLMQKYPQLAVKIRNTTGWQSQRHIVAGYLQQGYDFRPYAQNMQLPVTMIIGNNSKLYAPQGQLAYAAMLPQAKTIQLDNAGHALLFDRPYASYKIIKAFLES